MKEIKLSITISKRFGRVLSKTFNSELCSSWKQIILEVGQRPDTTRVLTEWMFHKSVPSLTWLRICFRPGSRSHVCMSVHVPAAITHSAVNPWTLPFWSSSTAGHRQEVSWEKRRKQKQLLLAAGNDPQPWPSTSTCISLTIQTDKTQTPRHGYAFLRLKNSFKHWPYCGKKQNIPEVKFVFLFSDNNNLQKWPEKTKYHFPTIRHECCPKKKNHSQNFDTCVWTKTISLFRVLWIHQCSEVVRLFLDKTHGSIGSYSDFSLASFNHQLQKNSLLPYLAGSSFPSMTGFGSGRGLEW